MSDMQSGKLVGVVLGGVGKGKSSFINRMLGRDVRRVSHQLNVDGTTRPESAENERYVLVDTVGVDSTNATASFLSLKNELIRTRCSKFTTILIVKYDDDRLSNIRDEVLRQLDYLCSSNQNPKKLAIYWRGTCPDLRLMETKRLECDDLFQPYQLCHFDEIHMIDGESFALCANSLNSIQSDSVRHPRLPTHPIQNRSRRQVSVAAQNSDWIGKQLNNNALAELIKDLSKMKLEAPDKFQFHAWRGDALYKVQCISFAEFKHRDNIEQFVNESIMNSKQAEMLDGLLGKVEEAHPEFHALGEHAKANFLEAMLSYVATKKLKKFNMFKRLIFQD
jgi:hypothetical protein